MHTFTDPADGETYVSALLGHGHRPEGLRLLRPARPQGADRADRRRADPAWTVLANGREPRGDDGRRGAFATTPPIPTYLFVVCAGPWHSRTWEHAGLPFGWHARASLGRRARPRLRRAASGSPRRCFDHYADALRRALSRSTPTTRCSRPASTGARWRRPGCVTFRDEYAARATIPTPASVVDRADRDRARDGAHVVRRPGDDEVVGGHLAQRVVRRLHGLPRGRTRPGSPASWPDFSLNRKPTRVRRGRASLDPPRRRGRRGRASTSTRRSPTST